MATEHFATSFYLRPLVLQKQPITQHEIEACTAYLQATVLLSDRLESDVLQAFCDAMNACLSRFQAEFERRLIEVETQRKLAASQVPPPPPPPLDDKSGSHWIRRGF